MKRTPDVIDTAAVRANNARMAAVCLCLALFAQSVAAQLALVPSYVPERVYDTTRRIFTDFEAMVADLARADVVFVGEQHDDPNTHRLEAAILQGLLRRRVPVTVSLEMFERDTQAAVDQYLAGAISENEFLKGSRPWPRYATDYRPLIEMAKTHGWPVIAANVPRRFAAQVAKGGIGALEKLTVPDRSFAAQELHCPRDAYFERFAATMNDHPAQGTEKPSPAEQRALTERYYDSQCVKDETMAEAIAGALERQAGQPGAVVHFNGAFHSDFVLGTAERTRRRLTGRKVAVVSILPVGDLDTIAPAGDDLTRANYLVYTIK